MPAPSFRSWWRPALLGFALLPARAEPPAARIHDLATISPPGDGVYHGWPTVGRRGNGELVVVWSGGREAHACPFGRIESMVSRDGGTTWSWPRVLFDSPIDDRDGGVVETARGTLLVTSFSSVSYQTSRSRPRELESTVKWQRQAHATEGLDLARLAGPLLLRSEDGGVTWSAAQRMPVNSPHGPIVLRDGRLLYAGVAGVGKGRFYQPGERRVGAWESRDDGVSWQWLGAVPARRGEDPANYHELHAVEAADGGIVAMIRSHADDLNRQMLQTDSRDGGRTWSEPRPIGLFGYPPHLLRLRDGRLLLTYDHRRGPFGVQARLSSDHGASWSEPLVLTSQPQKLDQGYPSTVQLDDGRLVTVWYEVAFGATKAVLRQARWSLPP